MSIQARDLSDHRFEMWQMDFYKSTLSQLQECSSTEDRVRVLRQVSLAYMFMQRFNEDPGFCRFVTEKIYVLGDGRPLRDVERLLEELADEIHNKREVVHKISDNDATNNRTTSDRLAKLRDFLRDESDEGVIESLAQRGKSTLEFLSRKLEDARRGNDKIGVKAISCLLTEYSMGCQTGSTLLLPAYPLEGDSLSVERWVAGIKKFIVCKVKHPSAYRYLDEIDRLLERNLRASLASPRMLPLRAFAAFPALMRWVLDKLNEKIREHNLVDWIKGTMFVGHVVTIASVNWFNGLSEEEKLTLLNRYYLFSVDGDVLESFSSIFGLVSLFNMASLLLRKGIIDESVNAYLHILSRSDDPFIKYSCYAKLAAAHLALGESNHAEEYLAQARDIPEGLVKRSNFMRVNELIICREIQCKIGHHDQSEEVFTELRKVLKVLEGDEKMIASERLTESLRRTRNFEKEYRLLSEIAKEEPESPDKQSHSGVTLSRLDILSKRKVEVKGESLDGDLSLAYLEKMRTYDDFAAKGKSLHDSFQFESSIKWYNRAYVVDNNPKMLLAAGISFFDCAQFDSSKYDASRDYFEKAASMSSTQCISSVYLGLTELALGNKTCAIEKLSQAMSVAFGKREHISLLGPLIESMVCNSPRDLHKILTDFPESVPNHEKSICYNDVGIVHTRLGFVEDAINYYEKALESEITPETRAIVFGNMGVNFMKQGLFEESLKRFRESLNIQPNNIDILINMTMIHLSRLDGTKALECIDRASIIAPREKASLLRGFRVVSEAFAKNALKVHLVKDEEAKHDLWNAETLFHYLTLGEETKELDLRDVFMYYSFALESILHKELSNRILEPLSCYIVNGRYGNRDNIGNLRIDEEYWYGNEAKAISRLPNYLRDLITNKAISSGAWAVALEKFHEKSCNPIEDWFKHLLAELVSQSEMKIIQEACILISSYWNPIHHPSNRPLAHETLKRAKSRTGLIEMRHEAVAHLNQVIDLFYSEKQES